LGIDPGSVGEFSLVPTAEYMHPVQARAIATHEPIEIGAYQHAAEYGTPIQ
jgi:hypothetical protein